jgi:hypothetical protein
MFDAPVLKGDRREPAEAGQQAFSPLLNFVKSCQDEGRLRSGDTLELALLAWSMVHAKLAITGRLPYPSAAEIFKFGGFVIDQSYRCVRARPPSAECSSGSGD